MKLEASYIFVVISFSCKASTFFAPLVKLEVKPIASFARLTASTADVLPLTSKPLDDFSQHKMFKYQAPYRGLFDTVALLELQVTFGQLYSAFPMRKIRSLVRFSPFPKL